MWPGLDGLQGPVLSGTGFYIKRVALCGSFILEGSLEFLSIAIDLVIFQHSINIFLEFLR